MTLQHLTYATTIACLWLSTATIAAQPRDDRATESLGWRLGVQAYTFNRYSFFDAVDKTKALGLKYIEMYPGQRIGGEAKGGTQFSMDKPTREAIRKKLADAGITLVNYGVVKAKDEKEWRTLFEFAKDMGIETIVSEPPAEQMPMLDKLCKEFSINVALHNHPKPSPYWAPETVLNTVSNCGPRIGADSDTGHWRRSGRDPRECLALLGPRTISLHFKDLNKTEGSMHDVPWGTGVNNVYGMLSDLKQRGFRGVFSIEYEYNWENSVPEIAQCVEYFDMVASSLVDEGFTPVFKDDLSNGVQQPGGWSFENGVLTAKGKGDIWTRAAYGDFILDLEFKTEDKSNSGVFLRTGNITNWLHTAIEVQILQGTIENKRENMGGIFDVLAPTKDMARKPGEWNRYVIMAKGSRIFVVLNGEQVTAIDLDQWTEAHKNPDGSPNKFNTAYKNMPRVGQLGLQYHGQPISFRNLRVKPL